MKLKPLYDEGDDAQLIRTHQFHGPVDFLRMLSYGMPRDEDVAGVLDALAGLSEVGIVDYGCRLAQRSIAIARLLMRKGVSVTLTLLDIDRELHHEFLDFICRKYGVQYTFVAITPDTVYPALPRYHYCDIVSVLEHLGDPLRAIENIDRALCCGGLLLASVRDEIPEMMHVSPNLKIARDYLDSAGYRASGACCEAVVLRKPVS